RCDRIRHPSTSGTTAPSGRPPSGGSAVRIPPRLRDSSTRSLRRLEQRVSHHTNRAHAMTDTATVEQQPELRRVMGPGLVLLFVVGDILGTGVYALTGDVAAEVGGAAWVPFLVAFLIATVTAFSYLELVTKYPQAAGA